MLPVSYDANVKFSSSSPSSYAQHLKSDAVADLNPEEGCPHQKQWSTTRQGEPVRSSAELTIRVMKK
ncbi:hypothetical protein J6590_047035 [Homalodisca vitripennis]|nr:hypothetical protein J6590_047035 [Homalodisca vitripennis]